MDNTGLPHLDVIRLGHRIDRDKRITSHLGLTARAFGADSIVVFGDEDPGLIQSLDDVVERFGGSFSASFGKSPIKYLRSFKSGSGKFKPGTVVHLTMYGEDYRETFPKIRRDRPIAFVVGGTKVPGELFSIADYNVSVGNQPHSEVAALAIALNEWHKSVATKGKFFNPQIEILPSERGKSIIERE